MMKNNDFGKPKKEAFKRYIAFYSAISLVLGFMLWLIVGYFITF